MKDFQLWKKIQKNKTVSVLKRLVRDCFALFIPIFEGLATTKRKLGLFLVPLILLLSAILFWSISQILSAQINLLQIQENPFPKFSASEYPIVGRQYLPDVTAQSAYVMDVNSLVPLFAKNETIRFSPASTTKIMTFLTALDYYKLDDVLTVERNFVDGSGLHFTKGEQLTFENLIYAMMLPSANDAAYAIADNYPGGMDGFVTKMNEKAASLHLANTHYQDSAGLEDDGDYTTAHDEAILASVALQNPIFAKVVDTKKYIVTSLNGPSYSVENLNDLLGLYGVIGVKTGYTDEAGEVLVTASRHKGHTYILVVMKSDDRFGDTEKLLQMIQNNVDFVNIGV